MSAVSTASNACTELSSDARDNMLSVVDAGLACYDTSFEGAFSPDQATCMFGVLATGSGLEASTPVAEATPVSQRHRHLLATGSQTQRKLLQTVSTSYTPPAFLATASHIAQLLSASAPSSGFLSSGQNGLYVSVANQLGRSYASSQVAAGPALTSAGGAADVHSPDNVVVAFNMPLTGVCAVGGGTNCR